MLIMVMNRELAQNWDTHLPRAIVSITDPDSKPAEFTDRNGSLKGVLRLQFHDWDEPAEVNGKPMRIMTEQDAYDIWEFVNAHKDSVEVLVVHCEAGISRSAGVAAGIAKVLDGDDEAYFKAYIPNRLCHKLMIAAQSSGERDA